MSVSLPGTQNPNNVWMPSSRGGQYVSIPYLAVGHDCHVKQKTILGSKYIPSIQSCDTGQLSVNGESTNPETLLTALTATPASDLTGLQLVSGVLICNPTAAMSLTFPTGATISTYIRSKFGGIILPGFGFDLRVKNLSASYTVTVNLTTNAGINAIVASPVIAVSTESTFTIVYSGNIGGTETWQVW